MSVTESLRKCSLFNRLDDDVLRKLETFCTQTEVKEGFNLFREGETARFLYVVDWGKVALDLSVPKPYGGLTLPSTVATAGPGEGFGWSAIVPPHVMTLSARAITRSGLVLIEAQTFREFLGRYREAGYEVMVGLAQLLSQRLDQTRETLLFERGMVMLA